MKCYLCINQPSDYQTEQVYSEMLDVALISGRKNTNLDFVCLYSGRGDSLFVNILHKHDVKIINHVFSGIENLPKTFPAEWFRQHLHQQTIDYNKVAGTFTRIDIPFIEKTDRYVLYADIDTMFESNIDEVTILKNAPSLLAAGPESCKDISLMTYFNAGVLLLNIDSMKEPCHNILQKINLGIPNKTGLFDQGYLNEECFGKHDLLPLEYNWKPYWGYNNDAKIIHFHGLKPRGTIANSGFAMSKKFCKHMLQGHECDFVGYEMYLIKYFNYLGKDCSQWVNEHCKEIFNMATRFDIIDDGIMPIAMNIKKIITKRTKGNF